MKNFNNKGFGGNRGGFGGGKPFGKPGFNKGGRDFGGRGDKQMFQTTCANCGKTCEVPFKPNGAKPVYCNDCFSKDDSSPRGDSYSRPFGKKDFGGSRDERSARPAAPDTRIDTLIRQMDAMNAKMDKLVSALESSVRKPEPVAMPTMKKAAKPAPAKKVPAKKAAPAKKSAPVKKTPAKKAAKKK